MPIVSLRLNDIIEAGGRLRSPLVTVLLVRPAGSPDPYAAGLAANSEG